MVSVCALLFMPAELAAQTKKLVFGYSTVGAMAAGSWMAKEIGAYEKYGIDAEMIYILSGPTTVQALLGGDIIGGVAATNAVIAAVLRGAPLVSVLSTAKLFGSFRSPLGSRMVIVSSSPMTASGSRVRIW